MARLHLHYNDPIDNAAAEFAARIGRPYCVEEQHALPNNLAAAARTMIATAQHALKSGDLEPTVQLQAEVLRHFSWFGDNFEKDGTPKRDRPAEPFNPARLKDAAFDFAAYAIPLVFGEAPQAPADWSR